MDSLALPRALIVLPVLLALWVGLGPREAAAQVRRTDLARAVERAGDVLDASIVGRRVLRVDHPVEGGALYFTALRLEGRSLRDGRERTLEALYPGGFLDPEHGVHNSEAPAADDVRIGSRVVAFVAWSPDLGGGVAGHALWGSHAGLYRTLEGPAGPVVLGRGAGYPVGANRTLGDLERAVRRLARPAGGR